MEQHILFKAGSQTFALPIGQTDRIIALENETRVPDLSSYIIGVQEIEGEVVVIVDLADRFYGRPNRPSGRRGDHPGQLERNESRPAGR
ncbi:MAG: chemotaxis protein CheW [Alkalibacterium sp.]|nr:chemotaxis protein CheW [Alkalibacterium sp.]